MKNYKEKYLKHYGYADGEYIPCEDCKNPSVDIHHIVHKSQGGTDDINNLKAVCRDCHNKYHI